MNRFLAKFLSEQRLQYFEKVTKELPIVVINDSELFRFAIDANKTSVRVFWNNKTITALCNHN